MASIIRIFDKAGKFVSVLQDVSSTRSWIMNKYGRCEFIIPYTVTDTATGNDKDNPQLTLNNFQFGNFIHIEHIPSTAADGTKKGKLPDWVGIILPNRTWDDNAVHITAYSAEALLAYRALPQITIDLPTSEAFEKIIEISNNIPDGFLKVQSGNVSTKSDQYQDNLKVNSYDHLVKLMQSSNMVWAIRSVISPDDNSLFLYADFFPSPVNDAFLTAPIYKLTSANTKRKNPLMVEQGTIINDIFAFTQAITEADRKTIEAVDQESVNLYGPFQANLVFSGVSDTSVLKQTAEEKMKSITGPRALFSRSVTDVYNAFSFMKIGNILQIDEPNIGFNPNGGFGIQSNIVITAVSYDDIQNEADLTIEVI